VELTATADGETSTKTFTFRWDPTDPIARIAASPVYSEGNAKDTVWASGDPGSAGTYSGVDIVTPGYLVKAIGARTPTRTHLVTHGQTSGKATTTLRPGATGCAFIGLTDVAGNRREEPTTPCTTSPTPPAPPRRSTTAPLPGPGSAVPTPPRPTAPCLRRSPAARR